MRIRSAFAFGAALVCAAMLGAAPAALPQPLLGTAWYPEQWPESRWEQDLELMQKAGLRMVRIGEFAWSTMEPSEGRFELDWMERAIALAAKHGMVTVMGTPSAAPPAWLTQKYPDTLRTEMNGRLAEHGGRTHFSPSSPRYRQLAVRIATEMAKRFGRNPNVVGWQIDNEYAGISWDADTQRDWQQWLSRRYKTLDNLNDHWTTAYWSQTYSEWGQIPMGKPGNNPSLLLEWRRFVTSVWNTYQREQLKAIRAHAGAEQFITSNFMGWHDSFDHYVISEELDFASWDNYVGRGHLNPLHNGLVHDLTRGFKRRNFWVMETQPGFVNWSPVNNALDKGEVRQMAWHAVAHGADAIAYWQWRSALSGQEQYHGTLVGVDGTPVPVYEEVAQLGQEFAKAAGALAGTSPDSQVAMLHTYDSRWAVNQQRHNSQFDPVALLQSYYAPLRTLAQQMDVVHPMAPLAPYRLVVAPALNVIPEEMGRHLIAYVEQGGHLVLGPRSGMKDFWNALWPMRQPGPLQPLLGARVEQWYALNEAVPVSGRWGSGTASLWAEQLGSVKPGAEVLLTYGASNGWLDGQPAALTRVAGKGRITYIAAQLDDGTMKAAAEWMLRTSGVAAALGTVPEGVEVGRRTGSGKQVFVLVNHTKEPQVVRLPRAMTPVLGGGAAANEVRLPPRGVEVLQAR